MATAAPACKAALAEASRLWPNRSRASDGILPSAAHTIRNPKSDHELGNAYDLSHDPAHGVNCHVLALVVTADRRVKYVIWDGRIWNPAVSPEWRTYTGTNLHRTHMHVSIHAACRDDTSSWWQHPVILTKEPVMADSPEIPNITGPMTFHPIVSADGHMTAYVVFSPTTGELHIRSATDPAGNPYAPFLGRSEDPTP